MVKKRQQTDNSLVIVAIVAIVFIVVLIMNSSGEMSFSIGESGKMEKDFFVEPIEKSNKFVKPVKEPRFIKVDGLGPSGGCLVFCNELEYWDNLFGVWEPGQGCLEGLFYLDSSWSNIVWESDYLYEYWDEEYSCNFFCGDGVVSGGEQCDLSVELNPDEGIEPGILDLNGETCTSLNPDYTGDLSCTSSCEYDTTSCESSPEIINYNLHSGLNLIGIPLDLGENTDLNSVFAELLPNNIISVIGEGVAAVYLNGVWAGSLNIIKENSGYWVNLAEDQNFSITGGKIINSTYDLNQYHNLVSFPNKDDTSIEDALCEYEGMIYSVLGEGVAAVYGDNGWIGSLTVLERENGYWIKTNQEINGFQYGSGPC